MERRLDRYRAKRDFSSTPEPGPARKRSRRRKDPMFVVQEHAASSHHFDFRLEVDGVLVSWAVPKGPSTDPRDKRLAVPTEDHPMEYASFEGRIPAADYGGGSVIVWDAGVYRNLTESGGVEVPAAEALADGHLSFWLEGVKLTGCWSLTRTGENWILVKRRDERADARRRPTRTQPESVLTGRTIDDIAAEA